MSVDVDDIICSGFIGRESSDEEILGCGLWGRLGACMTKRTGRVFSQ